MSLLTAFNNISLRYKIEHPAIILSVFSLLLSLGIWILFTPPYQQFVLFFPGAVRTEITGEPRAVPRYGSRETRIQRVVDEILLGPLSVEKGRVFPQGASVQSIMFRSNRLYIDFAQSHLNQQQDTILTYAESEAALRRSLQYNFPFIQEIIITIDGQVPFADPYVMN